MARRRRTTGYGVIPYPDREQYGLMKVPGIGPVGVLTGGVDVVATVGSAAVVTVWNNAQRAGGADVIWAMGEALVGSLIAMSIAAAPEAALMRDISLGTATGGAIYLINRLLPQGK